MEIAIGLSVIGLVSGFIIVKTIATNKAMRLQTTKTNIEIVAIAIASFLSNNNRLPRPSVEFNGLESSREDLAAFVGGIPYKTLGISSKYAIDGSAKNLIYIAEPTLTSSYISSIYERGYHERFFCETIISAIDVNAVADNSGVIVAFCLDTSNNKPTISDKIYITVSTNTFWVTRDILLMKYLKNCPCSTEQKRTAGDNAMFGI